MAAATAPPASPADTPPFDLVVALRRATRRSHHIANALILSKLVVALTDKKLYARALACFLPVYTTLERLQREHATGTHGLATVVAAVSSIPSRSAAMEADLQTLLGSDWRQQIPESAAASAYVQHLQHLADSDPLLLLPYVWSMHVPVLLGFMGQRIQRTLRLQEPPEKHGLAFFTVEDKAAKLAALRAAVTQAGREIERGQRQALMDEAVMQFTLNNAVVGEFSLGWHAVLQAVPAFVYVLAAVVVAAAVVITSLPALHPTANVTCQASALTAQQPCSAD